MASRRIIRINTDELRTILAKGREACNHLEAAINQVDKKGASHVEVYGIPTTLESIRRINNLASSVSNAVGDDDEFEKRIRQRLQDIDKEIAKEMEGKKAK